MDLTNVKVKTEPESFVYKGIHEIANIKTEDTCIKQEFSVKEEQLQYVDEVVVRDDVDGALHIQEEAQCDKKVKLQDKSDLHLTIRNEMNTSQKIRVSTIGTSLTNSIVSNGNGEKYIRNPSLRRNEQRTNFTCDLCKKTYSQRKYLIKHLKIHSGIRFSCKVCGKSFSQKSGLSVHMRRHRGDRYFCELCGKSFTDQRNLHVHIRRHTGGRFCCEICGKPFPLKIDLTKHMESHVDDL